MERTKTAATISADDFTHDAIVVRTCASDGGSYNGFKYPLTVGSVVVCPDWKPTAKCGNGLHGLLNGIGDWSLVDSGAERLWQIFGVLNAEVVAIDGDKVKFPRGKLLYCGTASGALAWFVPEMVKAIQAEAKDNTATGDRGHAAATGDSGHAAATGYRGHAAATGDSGHAAATGDRGHAAATGEHAIAASLGIEGSATANEGWIVLAAYNDKYELVCVKAAKVGGPEGVEANIAYRLTVAGEFRKV